MKQFSIEICQELFNAQSPENPFPIDFDLAWQWAGYTRKDNAIRALRNLFGFAEDVDWIRVTYGNIETAETQQIAFPHLGGNQTQYVSGIRKTGDADKYWLSLDTFEHFALSAQTKQGQLVRQHYIDCRRQSIALAQRHKEMHNYYKLRTFDLEQVVDHFYDRVDVIETVERRLKIQSPETPIRPARQSFATTTLQPFSDTDP